MDIHVNLEGERVHLKSGRSTWGLMCYEGVHGDERGMLRITFHEFTRENPTLIDCDI